MTRNDTDAVLQAKVCRRQLHHAGVLVLTLSQVRLVLRMFNKSFALIGDVSLLLVNMN